MKKILAIFCFATMLFSSCSKDDLLTKLYDNSDYDIDKENDIIRRALLQSTDGWFLLYKPSDKADTIAIWLKFKGDGSYQYQTNDRDYLQSTVGQYDMGGVISPELIFNEASIWGKLKNVFHGASKFKITTLANNFELLRADGFDARKFVLIKYGEKSNENFQRLVQKTLDLIDWEKEQERLSAETLLKLKNLSELEYAYFNNITLGTFNGLWSLDIQNKLFTITWREGTNIQRSSAVYNVEPGKIVFQSPLNFQGNQVTELTIGNMSDGVCDISNSTLQLSGKMHQKNTPAYIYPGAYDYTVRPQALTPQMRLQIQSTDDTNTFVSDELKSEYEQIANFSGLTYGGVNIYFNYNTNAIQRHAWGLTLNGSAHFKFFKDLQIQNESIIDWTADSNPLNINSITNANYRNLSVDNRNKMDAFFEKLFTGGVTIWPYGRNAGNVQLIRLINKNNSKIYLTVRVINSNSSTAGIGYID